MLQYSGQLRMDGLQEMCYCCPVTKELCIIIQFIFGFDQDHWKMNSTLQFNVKKLDKDFKRAITTIKPLVLNLDKEEEIIFCRIWIQKLIGCPVRQKKLRNIYMEQLCRNLEAKRFGPPFCDLPPEGSLNPIPLKFWIGDKFFSKSDDDSWTDVTSSETDNKSHFTSTAVSSESEISVMEIKYSSNHQNKKCRNRKMVKTKNVKKQGLKNFGGIRFKSLKGKSSTPNLERRGGKDILTEDQLPYLNDELRKLLEEHDSKNVDSKSNTNEKIILSGLNVDENKVRSDGEEKNIDEQVKIDCLSNIPKEIRATQKSNEFLKADLRMEKSCLEEICTQKIELQQEIASVQEKLKSLLQLKSEVHERHEAFLLEIQEQLAFQFRRAEQVKQNDSKIECELKVVLEDSKNITNFIKQLEIEWQTKCEQYSAKKDDVVCDVENEKLERIKELQRKIDGMKSESAKQREKRSKLEKQYEKCIFSLRSEIQKIRKENTEAKNAYEKFVNNKILNYKKSIETLKIEQNKIKQYYKMKLDRAQQSKGMELWVKKFDNYLDSKNDKQTQLESSLSSLEKVFHKQYSDVIDQA